MKSKVEAFVFDLFLPISLKGSEEVTNLQIYLLYIWGFPGGSVGKNPPTMQEPQETWVQSPGWEDPLEEGMATHSSILAWRILWTEEPGRLQSRGLQRVEYN